MSDNSVITIFLRVRYASFSSTKKLKQFKAVIFGEQNLEYKE